MYTRDNNTCEEFENVIKDLTINPTVQKMKEYRQHYNTSCYEHCLNVGQCYTTCFCTIGDTVKKH